ncbi:hypothetical protein KSP40_PGU008162 [Platanthera guangdongensis]|uniref:Uncharacterized protein n=1 Tax=Platanthera guangdongensis TaxID=2320717 RepID=A0ABR2LNF5_9ASPA
MAATQLSCIFSQRSRTLSRLPSSPLGDRGCPLLVPFLRRLEASPFSLITASILPYRYLHFLDLRLEGRARRYRPGTAWRRRRLLAIRLMRTFPHRSISCLSAARSSSTA